MGELVEADATAKRYNHAYIFLVSLFFGRG